MEERTENFPCHPTEEAQARERCWHGRRVEALQMQHINRMKACSLMQQLAFGAPVSHQK